MESLTHRKALSIAGLLLFITLVYCYIPFTQEYSTTPKWLIISSITLVATFFKGKLVGVKELGAHIWLWLGLILVMLLGSLGSYNFWDAITTVIPLLVGLSSVMVFNQFSSAFMVERSKSKIELYIAIIILPLVLTTMGYLFFWIFNGEYGHNKTYELRFAFGHRNQLSQFLVLLLPVFVNALQLYKVKWHKLLFIVISILIAITILLLQTRSAIVILVIIYPLLFGVYCFKKYQWSTLFSSRVVLIFLAVSAVALISIYFVGYFDFLFASSYGSGNERIVIWKNTVKMIQDSPLFGIGTGNWKIDIMNYPLRHTKAETGYTFYQRAHNEFFQVFAELGIIGFLMLVGFMVLVFKKVTAINNLSERIAKLAFVSGFLVIMNLSFPLERVEFIVLLFLVIGINKGGSVKEVNENVTGSFLQLNILRICCLIVLLFSAKYYNKELTYARYLKSGDVSILVNLDRNAYSIDPTSLPTSWYVGNYYYELKEFKIAEEYYKEAMLHNPNHVHLVNNLGGCYYAMNDVDNSIKFFERAKALNPYFTEVKMNLSALYFNQNMVDSSLNNLLGVSREDTPEGFQYFAVAIAQKKLVQLTEKLEEPVFEAFLDSIYYDTVTLLKVVENARLSGACYEDELRLFDTKK